FGVRRPGVAEVVDPLLVDPTTSKSLQAAGGCLEVIEPARTGPVKADIPSTPGGRAQWRVPRRRAAAVLPAPKAWRFTWRSTWRSTVGGGDLQVLGDNLPSAWRWVECQQEEAPHVEAPFLM